MRRRGWYTVAMFNVNDDVPTFTDVFNAVTLGEYYSLYAGDFALIHVEPADDEAALIAQYREEYRAVAAAYFAPFHDYDFEAGYYEGTFRNRGCHVPHTNRIGICNLLLRQQFPIAGEHHALTGGGSQIQSEDAHYAPLTASMPRNLQNMAKASATFGSWISAP